MVITIKASEKFIVGCVNNEEIVSLMKMTLNENESKWVVSMSTCLPTNITKAGEYVECMRQVFDAIK